VESDYHIEVDSLPQPKSAPLAKRLGDTVHVSPLLRKLCRISGCPEELVGEWLLKCAILRGAVHYDREFPAGIPPDSAIVSDEEIAVGLCLGQHAYNPAYLRAAAQLLSSSGVDEGRLSRLAVMERVEPVLLYIASIAERFAPEARPWSFLRSQLPCRRSVSCEALPHWSRFVSQTGITFFGGPPEIKWLYRREPKL